MTLPAVYIERAALFAGRPVSVRHTMKPAENMDEASRHTEAPAAQTVPHSVRRI